MSDPAATTLPSYQVLDPWESPLELPEKDERPEVPESALETFLDQSTLVSDQAEEYWTEHVLKRPFEPDEEEFRFNEHTHTDRTALLEKMAGQLSKMEIELGSLDPEKQKELRRQMVALREKRSQIIMEQAAADMAYLYAHRAKIESDIKDLAVNAQSQDDVEELNAIAEKALHVSSRIDKFQIYSESALNLFKKYRETAYNLSENIGDNRPNRDQEFMYYMLIAVEKSTGNDFEISSVGDRDYQTTFTDIRDQITQVDHKQLATLIAARVSQLKETVSESSAEKQDQAKPVDEADQQVDPKYKKTDSSDGAAGLLGGLDIADFQRDNQAEIAATAQSLDDADGNGMDDSRQGTNGLADTELPAAGTTEEKSKAPTGNPDTQPTTSTADTKEEDVALQKKRAKTFKDAVQNVFIPKKK